MAFPAGHVCEEEVAFHAGHVCEEETGGEDQEWPGWHTEEAMGVQRPIFISGCSWKR